MRRECQAGWQGRIPGPLQGERPDRVIAFLVDQNYKEDIVEGRPAATQGCDVSASGMLGLRQPAIR